MSRRDKRLRRIERLRTKRRRLKGVERLGGGSEILEQRVVVQRLLAMHLRGIEKRRKAAPPRIGDRPSWHDHPDGELNRRLGTARKLLLEVAPSLHGEDCLEVIGHATETLRWGDRLQSASTTSTSLSWQSRSFHSRQVAGQTYLVATQKLDSRTETLLDECGYWRLIWVNVRTDHERLMHFREQRTQRRRHAKLKRKGRDGPKRRGWPGSPRLSYRDIYLLGATKPCVCWLCKNGRLFNTKTGKIRNAA